MTREFYSAILKVNMAGGEDAEALRAELETALAERFGPARMTLNAIAGDIMTLHVWEEIDLDELALLFEEEGIVSQRARPLWPENQKGGPKPPSCDI